MKHKIRTVALAALLLLVVIFGWYKYYYEQQEEQQQVKALQYFLAQQKQQAHNELVNACRENARLRYQEHFSRYTHPSAKEKAFWRKELDKDIAACGQ